MNRLYIIIFTMLLLSETISAANYQTISSGMSFAWVSGDVIGLYSLEGERERKKLSSVNEDSRYAVFDSSWDLETNKLYYAFSPYRYVSGQKMKAVSAPYTGQKQTSNKSTAHLSAYDYQMTQFTTGSSSAALYFTHKGSILHFTWTMPHDVTLTSLTLSSTEALFTTEATMNLPAQSFASTTKAKSIDLTLNNIFVAKGTALEAYMALFPTDLTDKLITVTLTTSDGNILTADLKGTDVIAGKVYPIEIGADDTVDDSNSAKAIIDSGFSTTEYSALTAYSPYFAFDASHSFSIAPHYKRGDVNKDGSIDLTDVNLLADDIKRNVTDLDYSVCDVNESGDINMADVAEIIKICLENK